MISNSTKKNFETLRRACFDLKLAAVECKRKVDGKVVVLVCAMSEEGEEIVMVPLAEMIEENPYLTYFPPGSGSRRSTTRPSGRSPVGG